MKNERSMFGELFHTIYPSIAATIALAVICCGVYPAIVWAIGQVPGLKSRADGSLIYAADGKTVVASRLIGQTFTSAGYFQPRPSAAGNGYDPTATGGTNYGPTSDRLINGAVKTGPDGKTMVVDYDGIKLRTILYAQANGIDIESNIPLSHFNDSSGNLDQVKVLQAIKDPNTPLTFHTAAPIPADAVTASASGVDPHISVANALVQLPRVAKARGLSADSIRKLVDDNTDGRGLGIFGEPGVNVVTLNLALDAASH
jgi:K+-transporting ATPase ATPase C chain